MYQQAAADSRFKHAGAPGVRYRAGMRPALLPALVLVLPMAAQPTASFQARFRALDAQVAQYYRGPSPDAERAEVEREGAALTARIQAFNAQVGQDQAAQARVDAALKEDKAAIDALDGKLKAIPTGNDEPANRRYQALLAERNLRVKTYNARIDAAREAGAAAGAALDRQRREIEAARAALQGRQGRLNARIQAFNAFQKEGRDLDLFRAVNQLLADLRRGERSRGAAPPELAQVRGLRRELAAWAAAQERNDPHGLAVAEVRVGDEPCWFFVDTGAQHVCLPQELVAALGLEGALGAESPLVLAGGLRIQGRRLELPELAAGARTVAKVAASVIPATRVGVDGLLGQSFLRRVSWTLDPGRETPLTVH